MSRLHLQLAAVFTEMVPDSRRHNYVVTKQHEEMVASEAFKKKKENIMLKKCFNA